MLALGGVQPTVTVQPGAPVASATRCSIYLHRQGSCLPRKDTMRSLPSRLYGSGALGEGTAGCLLLLEAELRDSFLNSVTNATALQQAQAQLLVAGPEPGVLSLTVSSTYPPRCTTPVFANKATA